MWQGHGGGASDGAPRRGGQHDRLQPRLCSLGCASNTLLALLLQGISAEKAVADAERKAAAGLVSLDPREPTRAIIAAMTNAVTGVVSPIERHCTVKRGIATVRTDSPGSPHALLSHPG